MPDTIVPVVRRPVRRVSTTPEYKDLANDVRKLSIGEESSKGTGGLRKTWSSETGRSVLVESKKSPVEEVKRLDRATPSRSWRREESEEKEEESATVPGQTAYSGYPVVSKNNLPVLKVAKNRPIKTSKDLELERILGKWLELVAGRRPENQSFERWIQDGTVPAKAMISVCFNSVPLEMVNCNWGASPVTDRVKSVIQEMRRYGVSEVFEPEDLMELKNVPKVCRALARLLRLAASDSKSDVLKSIARSLPIF